MTTPANPNIRRRRNGNEHSLPGSDSSKARIFLAVACIWPLLLLALFASSSPGIDPNSPQNGLSSTALSNTRGGLGLNVRNVLDRVDIMGYGPTHPRVAVVIVGSDKDNLVSTLESVFSHTDMNRIFVVCVVVDGHEEDPALVKDLEKIDTGAIPHWHGLRPDLHTPGQKDGSDEEDDPHGRKVHVLFNKQKRGLTESRADAVQFLQILTKYHEDAGLKSKQEDLILLLLQSGAQLTSRRWLAPVTEALIVPPPIMGKEDTTVSMKLANAVSFNIEGPGKRTSFDSTFTPVISEPSAADINLSSGDSYPTPALNGAAVAMRLDTYVNLPLQDHSMKTAWAANLDLSLNLWLCADGIDMLKDLTVTAFDQTPAAPLSPEMAGRFAAAWMDDITAKKFFNAFTHTYRDITYLEWETYMAEARESPTFTRGLPQKCRSFQWYAQEINGDLSDVLAQSEKVETANEEVKKKVLVVKPKEEVKEKETEPEETEDAGRREPEYVEPDADSKPDLPDVPMPPPEEKDDTEDINDVSIPERTGDKRKPSVPLRDLCLEIVQKAKPIDITFVDVSGGHVKHPHKGARDENGEYGYIHDETALHKNPPAFNFKEEELLRECVKRDNNYKMLNEKVFVDLKADEEAKKSGKKRDKIFCLAYTISSAHPKIPAIRETWGSKCDGFMVGSNLTDASIGAVDIVHEGEEAYGNIWQKVRSMWSYIYDNYYEKYDWFHIGGDDLFLIVENLRLYLESEEIKTAANGGIYLPDGDEKMQTPLFLGRRFAYQGDMNDIFISGGSGYTMNKAALKALVVDALPEFMPHAHTFSEDTMVARALKSMGILPYETKDENGGERYMPFMPGHHYGYRLPVDHSKDWYARYSIDIKEGADHCAARSVAFHYVKGTAMKRLYALLYHLCPVDTQ